MKDELYHQAILDLARQATGRGRLEAPQASATVDNPLCGDRRDPGSRPERRSGAARSAIGCAGCLLCQAAASVIGARGAGRAPAALHEEAERLRRLIVEGSGAAIDGLWPELAAFEPVHAHKSRHDCVLLPFDALTQALEQAAIDD